MPYSSHPNIAPVFDASGPTLQGHRVQVVSIKRSDRPVDEGVRLHYNRHDYGYSLLPGVEGLGVAPAEVQSAPLPGGGSVFRNTRLTEGDVFLPIQMHAPSPAQLPDMFNELAQLVQPGQGVTYDVIVYDPYGQESRTRKLYFESGLTDPVMEADTVWRTSITGRFMDPFWYGQERVLSRKLGALKKKFLTAHPGTVDEPPTYTDSLDNSWSSPDGVSSSYHLYNLDDTRTDSRGLLVYLHGDGASEYNTPGHTTFDKYKQFARDRDMIMLAPLTPDDTSVTWWSEVYATWWLVQLMERLYDERPIDLDNIWFVGYSGGAEAISYYMLPYYTRLMTGGGAVLIGGGGVNGVEPGLDIPQQVKDNFEVHYLVGALDTPTEGGDDQGFDALAAATNGHAFYTNEGFVTTSLTVVPDVDHYQITQYGVDHMSGMIPPYEFERMGGYEFPFFPVLVGGSTIQNEYELTIAGDAPVWWEAVIRGPGTDLQIMNDKGQELFIPGQISEPIIIQTKPQERDITLPDGTPVWERLTDRKKRKMFPLEPGKNVLKISMVGADPQSEILIRYREAFYHALGGGQ